MSPWPANCAWGLESSLGAGTRTASHRFMSLYCSALRPHVPKRVRIVRAAGEAADQPPPPPCMRFEGRVSVKWHTIRGVRDILDLLRPGGSQCGRPDAQDRYCVCTSVYMLYIIAVADRSCATSEYLRVLVAVLRIDLPILRQASRPITAPMASFDTTKAGWPPPRDVQTRPRLFSFGALSSLHN